MFLDGLEKRCALFLGESSLRPPHDIAISIEQEHPDGLFMGDIQSPPETFFINVKGDGLLAGRGVRDAGAHAFVDEGLRQEVHLVDNWELVKLHPWKGLLYLPSKWNPGIHPGLMPLLKSDKQDVEIAMQIIWQVDPLAEKV